MRVLHLTTEFPPVIYGGLGTAIGGLVKALGNAGITVGVLLFGSTAGSDYGHFVPSPKKHRDTRKPTDANASIFGVSWFEGVDACVRIAARFRADILHLHAFWLWPIGEVLRERLGKPLVYTVH